MSHFRPAVPRTPWRHRSALLHFHGVMSQPAELPTRDSINRRSVTGGPMRLINTALPLMALLAILGWPAPSDFPGSAAHTTRNLSDSSSAGLILQASEGERRVR